eukprot:jgi/Psemu1/44603/gm1.44603_g
MAQHSWSSRHLLVIALVCTLLASTNAQQQNPRRLRRGQLKKYIVDKVENANGGAPASNSDSLSSKPEIGSHEHRQLKSGKLDQFVKSAKSVKFGGSAKEIKSVKAKYDKGSKKDLAILESNDIPKTAKATRDVSFTLDDYDLPPMSKELASTRDIMFTLPPMSTLDGDELPPMSMELASTRDIMFTLPPMSTLDSDELPPMSMELASTRDIMFTLPPMSTLDGDELPPMSMELASTRDIMFTLPPMSTLDGDELPPMSMGLTTRLL